MFDSGVRMHRSWIYDLVLISPEAVSVIASKPFTSRRLYQALSLQDVEEFLTDPEAYYRNKEHHGLDGM